jgi:hypothetical protein
VVALDLATRADGLGGYESEAGRENRQTVQEAPFTLAQ